MRPGIGRFGPPGPLAIIFVCAVQDGLRHGGHQGTYGVHRRLPHRHALGCLGIVAPQQGDGLAIPANCRHDPFRQEYAVIDAGCCGVAVEPRESIQMLEQQGYKGAATRRLSGRRGPAQCHEQAIKGTFTAGPVEQDGMVVLHEHPQRFVGLHRRQTDQQVVIGPRPRQELCFGNAAFQDGSEQGHVRVPLASQPSGERQPLQRLGQEQAGVFRRTSLDGLLRARFLKPLLPDAAGIIKEFSYRSLQSRVRRLQRFRLECAEVQPLCWRVRMPFRQRPDALGR